MYRKCHIRWSQNDTIYFNIGDHDGTSMVSQVTGALSTNVWHHIVCSFDYSADKKFVYINGVLRQIETDTDIGTINPEKSEHAEAGFIHIGSRRGGNDQFWVGEIDDFRIYDKLLSDGGVSDSVGDANNLSTAAKGEVLRNYNAGKRSHR